MRFLFPAYVVLSVIFAFYSYAFVDPNVSLSTHTWYLAIHSPLSRLLYEERPLNGILLVAFFSLWWIFYGFSLRWLSRLTNGTLFRRTILAVAAILLFSFPAFSYDLFNYITTAKVTFFWKENPYVVMPIEIPNEPNLAFTRAANKLALYGPTWIVASFFPSLAGFGNIWLSLIAFKSFVVAFYGLMLWLIFRLTNHWWNVVFFGLNPLVLSEVLVNGHNDIVMMVLAVGGLVLAKDEQARNRFFGYALFLASVFVKAATIVLVPLFFVRMPIEKVWRVGFFLMLGIFLLTPFREELYPWYAVWFLTFAALLPKGKAPLIHGIAIALSLGLVFRHLPYVITREYGGTGPFWRIIITLVPAALYVVWKGLKKYV